MKNNKFLSTLELKSGYHQIPINEVDVPSIYNSSRQLRFKRMEFGHSGTQSTFQRLVVNVLQLVLGKFTVVYMDDIINSHRRQ